jgi:hypothetical protein
MIEPHRHAAWGKEDSAAIADDQRPGVIHLEPMAAVQLHRENPERLL